MQEYFKGLAETRIKLKGKWTLAFSPLGNKKTFEWINYNNIAITHTFEWSWQVSVISYAWRNLSSFLVGISLLKSMSMWEAAAGDSIYVESVASVVRSLACWKSTSEHTPMSVHTYVNTATLPSKPKVNGCFDYVMLNFMPSDHILLHCVCIVWVEDSSCSFQETLQNTWSQRLMGKNARQWVYLSPHWTSQRARKQVLWGMGCIWHIYLPLCVGTQLDELLSVKNSSCSGLTADATPCSILLSLASQEK